MFVYFLLPSHQAEAIVDPTKTLNNRFGIHIISPTEKEASEAAQLVNSSGGDWGYITVLIESKDRDQNKWQEFFNELRRRHLIPIVRLATQPEGSVWKIPYEGEEIAWADFLDNLNWPVKNRYVVIYNEPNQGQEWLGKVDPVSYAKVLDKTIDALKNKNSDFFVLNAGFDASAPPQPPKFMDEAAFLKKMEEAVPGIFKKLDGWVSHSYPNPGFVGSPNGTGRGSVRTWQWELSLLSDLGVKKNLPVFITETGWKHAEGIKFDKSLPPAEKVGENFVISFQNAWNYPQVIAVTPFLLNYQEALFDHFSFKKVTGERQESNILGVSFPDYYPHYQKLMDLPKVKSKPVQDNKFNLESGEIYQSIVSGQSYLIPFKIKNTGQSIWNDGSEVFLIPVKGQKDLGIAVERVTTQKVEPNQEAVFNVSLKAPQSGKYEVILQLFLGEDPFDSPPLIFTTEVKSPVILNINGSLLWKENPEGTYILTIDSDVINTALLINLDQTGKSGDMEAKNLLPDHKYNFTLNKNYYYPKTITLNLKSGNNNLDFKELTPNFLSAIFTPKEFVKLLPLLNL